MKKIFYAIPLLMSISFTSLAATEIHDREIPDMKQEIGHVSVSVKNGTYSEAMAALSKAADRESATHYRVTSMGRVGMGSDISATAIIYR